MTDDVNRTADGKILPALNNFSQFLQGLEDGDVHAELTKLLPEISAGLTNHMAEFGGKPKAKIKIGIDIKLDGGVFEITASVDHAMPKTPRGKTVLWTDGQNRFTTANPKQMQMFARPVAIDHAPADVRTVSQGDNS